MITGCAHIAFLPAKRVYNMNTSHSVGTTAFSKQKDLLDEDGLEHTSSHSSSKSMKRGKTPGQENLTNRYFLQSHPLCLEKEEIMHRITSIQVDIGESIRVRESGMPKSSTTGRRS